LNNLTTKIAIIFIKAPIVKSQTLSDLYSFLYPNLVLILNAAYVAFSYVVCCTPQEWILLSFWDCGIFLSFLDCGFLAHNY
jgi:hypothetical protein